MNAQFDTGEAEQNRVRLVNQAMRLIQHDLSAELSVEGLAKQLDVSWSTLAHLFPGVTGETCWQYVKRLRLERAAYNLLQGPDRPILDIAFASGYSSQTAFTRAFRKAFGCSPKRFPRKAETHPRIKRILAAGEVTDAPIDLKPIPWLAGDLAVNVEQRPSVRLAYIRGVGPYEIRFIGSVVLKMMTNAWRYSLMQPEARFYGVMYEDPYLVSSDQIAYDACITLPDDIEPPGPFLCMDLPAGTWACVDCDGPPADHFASWNTFAFQWLPESRWTQSHPLVCQQYHLPGDLLRHPAKLTKAILGRFAATEMIPIKPGPVGSLLPV